jgi:hypothetical protein
MRTPSVALIALTAFACGITASQLFIREARAQTVPFAASIYVPSDGLAFRSFDGHVVARLSYGPRGGVFEVYDEREQVASRMRGEPFGQDRVALPGSAPTSTAAAKRPADPNNDLLDIGF